LLFDKNQIGLGGKRFPHRCSTMSDDHGHGFRRNASRRRQYMRQQWPPCQPMQYFGSPRHHPLALTGRHHNDLNRSMWFHALSGRDVSGL
jgi:hypothetical protein